MKVSVVIPAFNEIRTIEEIVQRVRATRRAAEIVVVDDGSTDGTRERLQRMDEECDGIRALGAIAWFRFFD